MFETAASRLSSLTEVYFSLQSYWRVQVKANGLIVFVPKYGIEGPVYLTEKDGSSKQQQEGQPPQQWLLDEERQTVRTADGSQVYSLFDKCAVSIHVEETTGHRQTLVLELVPREQLPASEVVA